MQSSEIPLKSPKIFGESAGASFIRPVPQTSADPAAASFDLGFPPQTFTDQDAGGTPPDGRDFNGILNFLTAWARWQSTGGPVVYDSVFQAEIGGYPKGAVVASAITLGVFWLSTAEDNMTNPDAGGAGWRRHALAGGLVGFRVISVSGTYAPTPGTNAVEVTVVGGGGGGGGTAAMGPSQFGAGGGGGSGGWATSYLATGFSGAAITIGSGGAGGIGGANGSVGGTSSFGAVTADGGDGGAFGVPTAGGSCQVGGSGGLAAGGNRLNAVGAGGGAAVAFTNGNQLSGAGGSTPFGGGGASRNANTNPGRGGGGPGAGGGGAVGQSNASAQNGGNGSSGVVIIREYA